MWYPSAGVSYTVRHGNPDDLVLARLLVFAEVLEMTGTNADGLCPTPSPLLGVAGSSLCVSADVTVVVGICPSWLWPKD